MKLEYFILRLLKIKPQTGYDIKTFLDTDGRFIRARTPLSQIYTTLKRMTKEGWIEFEKLPRDGKPDLKIYSTTHAGDTILQEWLSSPHEPSFRFQEREFLGKLFFSFLIDKQTILKHCYTELIYRKDQIAKFRGRDRTVQVNTNLNASVVRIQLLANSLHEYGKGAIDHYVSWLEEFIKQLEDLPDDDW